MMKAWELPQSVGRLLLLAESIVHTAGSRSMPRLSGATRNCISMRYVLEFGYNRSYYARLSGFSYITSLNIPLTCFSLL
jgi:hypothetical protein